MSVIAVVNSKGGTGKSTLATNLAGYLAARGQDVMLGDVDRQQSSRLWLNLRAEQLAKIHSWSIDENHFARPPAGVNHVVLDTPGGFHGFSLMKVTMYADAILIPASAGIFDREAASNSISELRSLPRVATGRCRLACIGMKIDGRTRNAALVESWARSLDLPHLGTIRLAQAYNKCLERGFSIFDFPSEKVRDYLSEWKNLTDWLDQILAAAPARPGSHLSNAERPTLPAPHAGTQTQEQRPPQTRAENHS